MTSQARAQRLVDEFWEHAEDEDERLDVVHQVRRGIAAVLRHLADTEAGLESFNAVPALEAPPNA